MKKFFLVMLVFLSVSSYAQFEPRIIVNDKEELKLSFLDIQVEIMGNYALSTYTMKFHNSYNRTLEGELNFPLLEGQSIVDFEMEVNGVLRKAVVVEKEKAK